MQLLNNNLKSRLVQVLDQFFELGIAITLLGNNSLCRENWQVTKGKNFSASQQQVLAGFETEVGVKG